MQIIIFKRIFKKKRKGKQKETGPPRAEQELKVANGPILGDPVQFKYLGNKFCPSTIFLAIHILKTKIHLQNYPY